MISRMNNSIACIEKIDPQPFDLLVLKSPEPVLGTRSKGIILPTHNLRLG